MELYLLDVLSRFRRRLNKHQPLLPRKISPFLRRNDPPENKFCTIISLALQIGFVPHKHHIQVLRGAIFDVFEPFFERLEALPVGDVVDQKGPNRAFVIGSRDRSERLLSGLGLLEVGLYRVSDLELDLCVLDSDDLGSELDADRRFVLGVEGVV